MHARWSLPRGGLVSAALLLALLMGGCGLSDYEERMKETQARALHLEQESKLLDEPVEVPTHQEGDKSVAVANVFFRPPKGIQRTPDDPTPRNNLYAYSPGTTATPGGAATASGIFYLVQLGFGGTADKDFAANVLRNFPTSGQASERRTLHPPGRAELVYDSTDFDTEQMSYSVNIYQGSQTQVAVIYSMVRGQRDRARPALLLSLESLGVDAEADRLREAFKNPAPWGLRQAPKEGSGPQGSSPVGSPGTRSSAGPRDDCARWCDQEAKPRCASEGVATGEPSPTRQRGRLNSSSPFFNERART